MFRSSTIIRELAMNLAKIIFMLKHSVELRHYLLCGCVAASHGMVCVLRAVQNATQSYSAHPLESAVTGKPTASGVPVGIERG